MVQPKTLSLEDIRAALPAAAFRNRDSTQYQAKLTFVERCEILALHQSGIATNILAEAFNLHRRTLAHMTTMSPDAKHYKDVRNEFLGRGKAEFIRTYVTEEGLERVRKAVETKAAEIAEAGPVYNARKSTGIEPNYRKDSKAGYHDNKDWGTRIHVRWMTAEEKDADGDPFIPGWYFAEDDGDWQAAPGGVPFNSSQAAYDKAMGK